MISVIMSFYNRQALLDKTLESIAQSVVKDYELIIVDDASEVPLVCPQATKLIRVERKDKWYTNPCVAYNRGFREATGDIILIQNPECYHVGDILSYVRNNIQLGTYLSFGCYAINKTETDYFLKGNMPTLGDYLFKTPIRNGWYNHTIHRPVAFHFCSAIMRKDLDRVGGFDERYARGVAYDDDAFIRVIENIGMKVNIINSPYVIHQYHDHSEFELRSAYIELHTKNHGIFYKGYDSLVVRDYSKNTNFFSGDDGDWSIIKTKYEENYLNYPGDKTPKIPKKLHMIWLGTPLPIKYFKYIATWKKHHPTWEFKLWGDEDVACLKLFNQITYDKVTNLGIRSALLRYEILYRYGGVYVDTDFQCIKPIDDLLYLDFFAGGRDKNPLVAEGLMGCAPGSGFMKTIIYGINQKQNNISNILNIHIKDVCWEYITKLFLLYIKTTNDKMVLFPDSFFYPMPSCFRTEIREDTEADRIRIATYIKPDTRCIHLWHTSWLPIKDKNNKPNPLQEKHRLATRNDILRAAQRKRHKL